MAAIDPLDDPPWATKATETGRNVVTIEVTAARPVPDVKLLDGCEMYLHGIHGNCRRCGVHKKSHR